MNRQPQIDRLLDAAHRLAIARLRTEGASARPVDAIAAWAARRIAEARTP